MLDTIRLYTAHTLFGILAEGVPALIHTLSSLVNRIAVNILFQVVITIPLFYLHHNLFALGFLTGFVFDKQVREVVDKVNVVYNAQRTLLEKVAFFGGGGFLAVLTMPTSMIIATLYYSAQWGAHLYQTNLTHQKKANQDIDPADDIQDPKPAEVIDANEVPEA